MLKKILLGIVIVIIAFVIFVALRPADFRVERSLSIAAPAQALFDQVNDHHKFNQWNPFLKLDPNVKNTFSGPDAGVGAVCSWDGNKDIGAGSATITESKPGELVRMRMDWKRPMEGVAMVDFTFKADGAITGVAGPAEQEGQPVGTLCVGVALPDGRTASRRVQFGPGRETMRQLCVITALDALRRELLAG